jgi:pimeloyl-ACP methyl ester carboxylesterase
MIQKLLFLLFLVLSFNGLTQARIEGTSYTHFQIKLKTDTINFVIADTNLTVSKPLLLFCQGSLPVPLFIDFGKKDIWPVPLNNFNLEELNKNYHVAVISMPKTPLVAKKNQLNSGFSYVTDTADQYSYSTEFIKANDLDNYVNRANKVLKFLKKQKWIQSGKIIVAGHSQGAPIAKQIALENKNVTQLGLFGVNPFGRIDQMIRTARLNAHLGKITWEEADSRMNYYYETFKYANNSDSTKQNPNLKTLKSFSKPFYNDLLKLDIPIYIAYGTEDRIADLCDLMPLYFIAEGKNNLTLKRYIHLDHNFFEVDDKGIPNFEMAHWEEVMQEFLDWVE